MSQPAPNWAALYQKHRDAMYRVAATELRGAGLTHAKEDVVQAVFMKLMAAPPEKEVRNWEAFLVTATKNKARDYIGQAEHLHRGTQPRDAQDPLDPDDLIQDTLDDLDRAKQRAAAKRALETLEPRLRAVAWERIALARPRNEVAAELGLSPGRISQMAEAALEKLREAM